MTKHQKQAHNSSNKRASLQWRSLNEMLSGGGKKQKKPEKSWRPLDEVLQDGKLLQQKLDAEAAAQAAAQAALASVSNSSSISFVTTMPSVPASPVLSEQSSATLDEDMIYSLTTAYQHKVDNWYPSSLPFYHGAGSGTTTVHHHQWLPTLCKEQRPYYPQPLTVEDAKYAHSFEF
jgi:hypothetical protein